MRVARQHTLVLIALYVGNPTGEILLQIFAATIWDRLVLLSSAAQQKVLQKPN